jgi:hypothetical protein
MQARTHALNSFIHLREHQVRVRRAPEARHAQRQPAQGPVDAPEALGGERPLRVHFHDVRDQRLGHVVVEVRVVLGVCVGGCGGKEGGAVGGCVCMCGLNWC